MADQTTGREQWLKTLTPHSRGLFDTLRSEMAVLGWDLGHQPMTLQYHYRSLRANDGKPMTSFMRITLRIKLAPSRAVYTLNYKPFNSGGYGDDIEGQYTKLTSLLGDVIILMEGLKDA